MRKDTDWRTATRRLRARGAVVVALAWTQHVLLLTLFVCYCVSRLQTSEGLFDATGDLVGGDFVVFWSVAELLADGHAAELYDARQYREIAAELFPRDLAPYAWVHPPQTLMAVSPLGLAPYAWALVAWSVLGLATYGLATGRLPLLLAPATFVTLATGQAGLLFGALYLAALRLLARRPLLAGACIACLAVKPQLGLMLPIALLASRAYATVLAAAVTATGLVVLSAAVFGWDVWRAWLLQALPDQMASIAGAGASLGRITVSAFSGARLLGWPEWTAWLAQAPFAALAASATWWAFSRARRGLLPQRAARATLLLATCLATPYMFVYDLVLASPVALWWLAEWRRRPWTRSNLQARDLGEPLLWCAVWMLPFLALLLNPQGLPLASPVLAAALVVTLWRGRRLNDE